MNKSPGFPQTRLDKLQSDHRHGKYEKRSYTISIITPMFGGGYEVGQVDSERLARVSAIKGHLRFWWRATRGAAYKDVQELRKREAEIFGDTTQSSPVRLRVLPLKCSDIDQIQIPQYILISRPKPQELADYRKTLGYRFKLEVLFDNPDLELEIQAALWGWINFGGLGARTRRGCGSLYCPSFSPSKSEIKNIGFTKWFKESEKKYKLSLLPLGQSRLWPTLSQNFRVRETETNTSENWHNLIKVYSEFRRKANNRGNSATPGRSYWPEADAIRSITKWSHPSHKSPFPSSKPKGLIAFPRASLGMPIVFHFKRDKGSHLQDPFSTQLFPKDKHRLASPIILKPLAYDINESLALIAILNQPMIEGVELRSTNKNGRIRSFSSEYVYSKLDYRDTPMKMSSGDISTNAIEAFLYSKEVEELCQQQHKN